MLVRYRELWTLSLGEDLCTIKHSVDEWLTVTTDAEHVPFSVDLPDAGARFLQNPFRTSMVRDSSQAEEAERAIKLPYEYRYVGHGYRIYREAGDTLTDIYEVTNFAGDLSNQVGVVVKAQLIR